MNEITKSLRDYKTAIDLLLDDESLYCESLGKLYFVYNGDKTTIAELAVTPNEITDIKDRYGDDWLYMLISCGSGYLHDGEAMLSVIRDICEYGYEKGAKIWV
jgi:hypothetical protein